jgi:hypothetical protein
VKLAWKKQHFSPQIRKEQQPTDSQNGNSDFSKVIEVLVQISTMAFIIIPAQIKLQVILEMFPL